MALRSGSLLGEREVLTQEQVALVRHHLEAIVGSRAFAGSKRTQDFLRLIVGHALEGEVESLRERMIGAEMFGRPVGYDTGNDSVVRVRASEVRKKLAKYYEDLQEQRPPVRIELASGSYVPKFHFERAEANAAVPGVELPVPASQEQKTVTGLVEPPAAAPYVFPSEPPQPGQMKAFGVAVAAFIVLILIAAYIGYKRWAGPSVTRNGIHSIAILPLKNLSGSPAQDYFADGLTEELINDLGQVSTLRVISLTSSMSYKGTNKKLPEIARELSVEGVVEGGVLRQGSQVSISAQLIDARYDRQIWAHTYTRDLTAVFAWQGEVAQTIAEEIRAELTPQQQAHLAQKHTIDPEAQDDYLHGILLRESDDIAGAIGYFTRAIQRDQDYAQAHSALATCFGRMGESGRMPYQEAFSRQKAEALRAIQLDDSLSEAHAELANTAMTLDWDWATAVAEFHKALDLNPSSSTSHQKYAFYLVRMGRLQDAIAETQRSVDLDPVSGSTFHSEGFIYYFSRRYDQALALTRTVRGLKIDLPDWSFLAGDIYAEEGRYSEAIAEFLRSGEGPYSLGHLGNAYARAGQIAAAQKTIARLEQDVRKDGVGRYEIALVYAGLGRKPEAFQWLDQAYQAHDVGLVYLKVDPCLDPLRSDPRFNDLMLRVGLHSSSRPVESTM